MSWNPEKFYLFYIFSKSSETRACLPAVRKIHTEIDIGTERKDNYKSDIKGKVRRKCDLGTVEGQPLIGIRIQQ